MAEEKKLIHCPKCGKDYPAEEFKDGRCPCGFNMQRYIDDRDARDIENIEREDKKGPSQKKLYGF